MAPVQPFSVATPLSAPHQVSLGTPVSPMPAVGNSHLEMQGSTPFVACAPTLPAASLAPSQQATAQVLAHSLASLCSGDLSPEQAMPSVSPPAHPSAIRSYSPADALAQSAPAVAAPATNSLAAQQAAWAAQQMPVSASKEAPTAAKHANGDAVVAAAEESQAAQPAQADTQLKQGTTEAPQSVKPASNGLQNGKGAATSTKPVQSSSKDSDVEMLASEESEAEEITSEQDISGVDSLNGASNRYSASCLSCQLRLYLFWSFCKGVQPAEMSKHRENKNFCLKGNLELRSQAYVSQ